MTFILYLTPLAYFCFCSQSKTLIPLDLRSTTEEDGVGDACTDAAATGNEDWENGNAAEGDGSFATPATVADRGVARPRCATCCALPVAEATGEPTIPWGGLGA